MPTKTEDNARENQFELAFTKRAQADLDGLFNYISHQLYAPKAANKLMQSIEKSILNLKQFPYIAPLCKDEMLSKRGYYALYMDKYVALYRVNENKKIIIVHRVFYGRMDYTKLV